MATVVNTNTIYATKWSLETIDGERAGSDRDPMLEPEMPFFIISQDGSLQGKFGPVPVRGNANINGSNIEFNPFFPRIWAGDTIMLLESFLNATTRFTINDNTLKLYSEDRELATFKPA